ncbi:MAG: hypothetical protein H7836_02870 [Magnetococcus sp. YQC-3]
MPDEQAKGHVKAFASAIRQVAGSKKDALATKGDVEIAKLELQKEIESVRKEIEVARVDITKWVIITGITILGGVAAINRLAPPVPAYYQPLIQEMRQPAPPPALPVPPAAAQKPG